MLCICDPGFVRGVDPEKKEIYIVTPLPVHQLTKVNTIVRGDLNIPDQILLKQVLSLEPWETLMIDAKINSSND